MINVKIINYSFTYNLNIICKSKNISDSMQNAEIIICKNQI